MFNTRLKASLMLANPAFNIQYDSVLLRLDLPSEMYSELKNNTR